MGIALTGTYISITTPIMYIISNSSSPITRSGLVPSFDAITSPLLTQHEPLQPVSIPEDLSPSDQIYHDKLMKIIQPALDRNQAIPEDSKCTLSYAQVILYYCVSFPFQISDLSTLGLHRTV